MLSPSTPKSETLESLRASRLKSLCPSIVRRLAHGLQYDTGTAEEKLKARQLAYEAARRDIVAWFNDWAWTYDPREGGGGFWPFILFPKQIDYVRWVEERIKAREEFILEKSRDTGATYLNAGIALHHWLFEPGFKTTFGANKAALVDTLGDPDSIFEKLRIMLFELPHWMQPMRFRRVKHDLYMRLINPDNGNLIDGEGGDNMGRGGRSTVYFIDEAAHVERCERVDAATLATADVRGWVSSVNGMGNVFARKRHSGRLPVFTLHWSDDPRRNAEWAKAKKWTLNNDSIWAAEYDIDYSAAVEGVAIPGKWVQSARLLADLVDINPAGGTAGFDVGAGKAESVFIARRGALVEAPIPWMDPDTNSGAHKALDAARASGIKLLNFDSVGVGHGVTSVLSGADTEGLQVQAINVGVPASKIRTWPDGRTSEEMFANLKAELWWLARERFKCSHERYLWETGNEGGIRHPLSDCIVLPEDNLLQTQLSIVKWGRNERGKIAIETKDKLRARGVASPDRAEALILSICEDMTPQTTIGSFPFD